MFNITFKNKFISDEIFPKEGGGGGRERERERGEIERERDRSAAARCIIES